MAAEVFWLPLTWSYTRMAICRAVPSWSPSNASLAAFKVSVQLATAGGGGLFGGTFWVTIEVFDVPGSRFWFPGFGDGGGGGGRTVTCFAESRGGLAVTCCAVSGGVTVPPFGDFSISTATAA